jgi:hypothetical protein
MRVLLISVSLFILTAYSHTQKTADGRWLPDSTWQPRNQHATIDNSPGNWGDWPIVTGWGDDIRLTYFDDPRAHNPEIAVSDDYVYVAWWYLYGDTIFFVRSTDSGLTWEENRRISELEMHLAVIPNISASENHVYVVYKGGMTYQGVYLQRSTNYGITWLPTQALYITARHLGSKPTIVSNGNNVYVVFRIHIDLTPPGDWDFYFVKSTDYGETWSDTAFVSDTVDVGLGPDLAINSSGLHLIRGDNLQSSSSTEILYNRSTDNGDNWEGTFILSHDDTSGSFWPQIAAWNDSNVIVSWTDYKYSPYAWTGDAFICRSTDNGETWSQPVQMTDLHLVKATDISANGDTVFLTYSDFRYGDREIMANISFDGGGIWEGEERLTIADGHSIEPSAAIADGVRHVAWSDARQNPDQTVYEVYYKRGDFQTGISGPDLNLPISGGIVSYPNPFNSTTTITLNHSEGGDARIGIYDIQGRLIKELNARISQGGDKKAVWDATDNSGRRVSSGIYFVRVDGTTSSNTIKLLYLR